MFRVVLPPIIRCAYNCICSIWYLSHRYCYLPLLWKSWDCSPNSSMIVTGSSNIVTNTRSHTHHQEHIQLYLQHLVCSPNSSTKATGSNKRCDKYHIAYPSLGVHTTVSAASVICHTVTATCRYRGRVGTAVPTFPR
jgi:hypothetical protein